MIEEPRSESELECERFLREKGLPVSELMLSDYEKWNLGIRPDYDSYTTQFAVRHEFIRTFGFAVLTGKAIEAMRPHAPLLELGAGSGYWSYELRKHGIDVIPTDDHSGEYGHFREGAKQRRWEGHFLEPEKLDALDAVRKYPNRNLLVVWPDYKEPWAADALSIFTGKTVIYMGEGEGGCTADDWFHELLETIYSDQEYVRMPHFWGLHDDHLTIARKPQQLTWKG